MQFTQHESYTPIWLKNLRGNKSRNQQQSWKSKQVPNLTRSASRHDDTTENSLFHAFEGENDIYLPETCSLREILHSIAYKTPKIPSLVLDHSFDGELKQEYRK